VCAPEYVSHFSPNFVFMPTQAASSIFSLSLPSQGSKGQTNNNYDLVSTTQAVPASVLESQDLDNFSVTASLAAIGAGPVVFC